jgi:two-component system sensor histidine kinase CpxA
MFNRHRARLDRRQREREGDVPGRPGSRLLPQLVAPTGEVLTMLAAPVRAPEAFWNSQDIRVLLFVFALMTSGLVSYALAKVVSRPVRKLRAATVSLAKGDLDARVGDSMGKRRDELGMLGRDFDAMAEQLQRAAERQTELSRNISHELRSPLARMRVAVELARRKSGELPEFDRLDLEAERLDALIGQILSYHRLEGDAFAEHHALDVTDVINEVLENVNFEIGEEKVALDQRTTEDVRVNGYRSALLSAIENVVRNALRHGTGSSVVTVVLDATADDVLIDIEDDGPGVDDADLSKLFEPFFRTRASAEANGNGGTGLGLAIAQRAIELNEGHIEARNRESGGLAVAIRLPRL